MTNEAKRSHSEPQRNRVLPLHSGESSVSFPVIDLNPQDDLASIQHYLDGLAGERVALMLPWDISFLSRELEFDLLRREAECRQLDIAILSPDPERRQLARSCGFPAFADADDAERAAKWRSRPPEKIQLPPRHWWDAEVDPSPRPVRPRPSWLQWLKLAFRLSAFIVVIVVLAGSAYIAIPHAKVTIVPAGKSLTAIVPVSVDPEAEEPGLIEGELGGIIPSRRVGVEVENYAEVETTGRMDVAAGQAGGSVLFTSLLTQDYVVPSGTIVRTSSTSYPIRFRTTADVTVPAGGQATAPIRALEKGTGNVGAYQINQVEGVAGSAVRVINPQPTTGAEPEEVRVVTQADYDRVRELLNQQLLDQAYTEMGALLEPTEFLPRQTLRIEAVPKKAYTHFITEQADKVGLNMRLLVSGQAVDVDSAEGIAYSVLARRLPAEYGLVDARFDLGEVAEEDIGPGWFTFFVTAHGYAAAALDTEEAVDLIRGQRPDAAAKRLREEFPLAEPPQFTIWPDWPQQMKWLERLPILPLRISVKVLPKGQ
jgi:hypothetical protein